MYFFVFNIRNYIGKSAWIIALFLLLFPICVQGAEEDSGTGTVKKEIVAIKNNLLYDAMLTPNLALEFRLTPKWSMEVGAGFNPFPLDDAKYPKWRHLAIWVAPRYWFCHVYNRGFFSFNAAYAHYNVAGGGYPIGWIYTQLKDYRYQGDAVMAGESAGWHFAISPHFSIELEAGVDFGYTWYDQFECTHCGYKRAHTGHWFALPKAAVNLVVPFGGDRESLAKRCDCEILQDKNEPVAVADTIVEEPDTIEREQLLPAQMLRTPFAAPAPVIASVPAIRPRMDNMRRLRSRLLRDEDEYEPYDVNTALSADPRNVFLFFEVNVTKMDRSFIQNDLLMDSIMHILGEAMEDPTIRISHVRIVGFASFDGRKAYNERLAGSRAQTIKEYMQSIYALPDSIFEVANGGESWAELYYQLEKVDFEGRDEVLMIIDTEPDPDQREVLIKKLYEGRTYRYMRDELKHILRNLGCITIFIEKVDE